MVRTKNPENNNTKSTNSIEKDKSKSKKFVRKVDDASCNSLPGEVDDSTIDSEDRSLNGRITDVLASIHGEDDIEEFGDAAQNGYATVNEEVV
ncbi:hypothetical protein K7X08_037725 [Anisodus acutangulus]|uniref:Uncharacterized protein n=1 Tax=Anisodus acutangulus TaxID=402998 RepID=A0A9Q1MYD1_9SOLA|nr:hypothetical protein K7X08_037725 [Anisodus acutangulus]